MSYRIAGIDVHKRMLAVVITDVAVDGGYVFVRERVGTSPSELRRLAGWLAAQAVEEVVMESTAQYWRPVGGARARLDAAPADARRGEPDDGHAACGVSLVKGPSGGRAPARQEAGVSARLQQRASGSQGRHYDDDLYPCARPGAIGGEEPGRPTRGAAFAELAARRRENVADVRRVGRA